jgi:stearoyl-CoA desaturase (Delta-9 desaturase)
MTTRIAAHGASQTAATGTVVAPSKPAADIALSAAGDSGTLAGSSRTRKATTVTFTRFAVGYDGVAPFPDSGARQHTRGGRVQVAVALTDIVLAVTFYIVTGLGISVGFHRLLTHRAFTAGPALRAALAVAGSMSFEGDVIGWVATHRRHHAFTDRPGDPHSPYRYGTSLAGQLRGLAHAHMGWLLREDPTPRERYAPDLLADPATRAISAAFPALSAASLALPFGAGWALGGTWRAGLLALLWAGLVRILLLQHVTWSVNSLCHMFGSRPYATRRHDRATNLWPLALLSFGESWHNMHHSDPACARHGADPHQIDISASLIRIFERLGWASAVRWPDPDRLAAHRRNSGRHQPPQVLEPAGR